MSARLLRKVLKEQEQTKLTFQQDEENLDKDDSDSSGHAQNPFDLLNDDDGGEQNLNQEADASAVADNASIERIEEHGSFAARSPISAGLSSSKKSKKKKNKKSKGGPSAGDQSQKSLDAVLESLNFDGNLIDHQASSSKTSAVDGRKGDIQAKPWKSSILKVESKYLNAENELQRIFGTKVVKSLENANRSSNPRPVRGGRRGGHIHRKSLLVSPSDNWPRWDGSFSMELLETKDGSHYFRYAHSPSYSQAQRAFEAAKAIHDLNGVARILLYHPYHVDSLMTLADYFKFSGEPQMAADAVGKCLYALECAWHPMFTPMQGKCRLEYSHESNRPLFSTLFTHVKNLDRRGCHRSALEVCKLLLSLDPADPMGALFCIDYYALRAEEYAWLERFSEEYQSDTYVWHFPNFAYSLAICRFYLECEESSKDSNLEHGKETSFDLMKQALMLHPPVLKKLVAKVPLKDQAWTNIIKNAFFKSEEIGIPSLDHLINIYVERSYLIWRLPDVQKLVKDAALSVMEILGHDQSEVKTWACVRKEAFPSAKNEYKHLLVSDFSDAVPTLPPDNLQNFMIDPGMQEVLRNQNQGANQQAHAPRDLTNRSPLAVLFESLFPWVDYGTNGAGHHDQPNGHPQHDEDH